LDSTISLKVLPQRISIHQSSSR